MTELIANAADQYYERATQVLGLITQTQQEAIRRGARMVADVVKRDGIVYSLGSGHSLIVAMEFYYRAGGMAPFDIINDKTFGRAERLTGYAKVLLDSYPISCKDLLILISNSGRNCLPVEMAYEARNRGIATIGITSLSHSLSLPPRNSLGLRLCEVCDLVIDNCGVAGDASVALSSTTDDLRVGPTSSLAGVFIASSLASLAAEYLLESGHKPPVFASANIEGGDERNASLLAFMRARIRGL
jgi:uncharacterized phosphosugar-binding protein